MQQSSLADEALRIRLVDATGNVHEIASIAGLARHSLVWLSPAWQEPTCFFGFVVYYAADCSLSEEGLEFLRAAERRLAKEGGKPRRGKYYDPTRYDWPTLYPQWSAFQEVRQQLDPQGKFLNAFMKELLA